MSRIPVNLLQNTLWHLLFCLNGNYAKARGKKKKFKKSVIHELRLMLEHGTKPAAGMTEHRPSRAPVQLPARRDGR